MSKLQITNINTKKFQEDYLVLNGTFNLVPYSESLKLDLTNNDDTPVKIILSQYLYSCFKETVKKFPVAKREIELYDYNGMLLTRLNKGRKTNNCGTVTSDANMYFMSDININHLDVNDKTTTNYICIDSYPALMSINSNELKNTVLERDFLTWYNKYTELSTVTKTKCFLTNKVSKKVYEHSVYDSLINLYDNDNDKIIEIICEEIFGKILFNPNQYQNILLSFDNYVPLYATTNKPNTSVTIRKSGINVSSNEEFEIFIIFESISESYKGFNIKDSKSEIEYYTNEYENFEVYDENSNSNLKLIDFVELVLFEKEMSNVINHGNFESFLYLNAESILKYLLYNFSIKESSDLLWKNKNMITYYNYIIKNFIVQNFNNHKMNKPLLKNINFEYKINNQNIFALRQYTCDPNSYNSHNSYNTYNSPDQNDSPDLANLANFGEFQF